MSTILITGATGFLGTHIARRLQQEPGARILALVRAADQAAAESKLARAWFDFPDLVASIGYRVEVLPGDVSAARLGMAGGAYEAAVQRVTHIVHAAAGLRLTDSLEDLRRTNVLGTRNVLEFARAAHADHGLHRLGHISTAYVCGSRRGTVSEGDLGGQHDFSNAYEQSKFEAELRVREAKAELPISVFRPAMIVGDSESGAVKSFNTLYPVLRRYLAGRLRVVPASPDLRLNIVPVDYVADAIVRLMQEDGTEGLNFHLSAPYDSLPTAGEFLELVRRWAKEHLQANPPRPVFLPISPATTEAYLAATGNRLSALAPYLREPPVLLRENVDRWLGNYTLDWREFSPRLFEYATRYSFMHRSGRTVPEQILYRLEGHGPTIVYHDLVEGQPARRSGHAVRSEALKAASALQALGIRKGDRVAVTGLNSSRYLALDVAIGLVGAVSVPLYYTSPPAEIKATVEACGARLLLVGAPQVLARLTEGDAVVPVVSFCREPVPSSRVPFLRWEEFITLGKDRALSIPRVDLSDLATLRYTSGTTGAPKGVMFSHGQVRWMAETMASLLPWKARLKPCTYLSFLPMNHVVEGILAMYAPYFVPAPLAVHFLEDFRSLERALPKVRPTVFFSVPRVYEKIWDAFARSGLGHVYGQLERRGGASLIKPLLRLLLLRKAGLDRCRQLIAGSAPVSADLLNAFRSLGIDIHNAYGLSEAPLVSLNRVGANRIGTVGRSLPETEVRVAPDGEVLVKGPQVTLGYYGEGTNQPFEADWLRTGDLGSVTDGNLTITGRKKEIIATAYGKKIHPGKVEALLKEIPGVAEAMLVGENRPYCTALLWLEPDHPPLGVIDSLVLASNARLSHPEQVKAWAILAEALSIGAGDLTPNMKLRRQAVAERFKTCVEALYFPTGPSPEYVLHTGRAELSPKAGERA